MSQPWGYNTPQTSGNVQMFNPAKVAQPQSNGGDNLNQSWDWGWNGTNENAQNANPLDLNPSSEEVADLQNQNAAEVPAQNTGVGQFTQEQWESMTSDQQWAWHNYWQQMHLYQQQGNQEQQQGSQEQHLYSGGNQQADVTNFGEETETDYDDGGTVSRFFGGDSDSMMEDIPLEDTELPKDVAHHTSPKVELETFDVFGNTHLQAAQNKIDFTIGSDVSSAVSSAGHSRENSQHMDRNQLTNGEPEVRAVYENYPPPTGPARQLESSASSAGNAELPSLPHGVEAPPHSVENPVPVNDTNRTSRPPSTTSRSSSASPGIGPPPMAKAGAENPFRRSSSRGSKYAPSPLAVVKETSAFPFFQPTEANASGTISQPNAEQIQEDKTAVGHDMDAENQLQQSEQHGQLQFRSRPEADTQAASPMLFTPQAAADTSQEPHQFYQRHHQLQLQHQQEGLIPDQSIPGFAQSQQMLSAEQEQHPSVDQPHTQWPSSQQTGFQDNTFNEPKPVECSPQVAEPTVPLFFHEIGLGSVEPSRAVGLNFTTDPAANQFCRQNSASQAAASSDPHSLNQASSNYWEQAGSGHHSADHSTTFPELDIVQKQAAEQSLADQPWPSPQVLDSHQSSLPNQSALPQQIETNQSALPLQIEANRSTAQAGISSSSSGRSKLPGIFNQHDVPQLTGQEFEPRVGSSGSQAEPSVDQRSVPNTLSHVPGVFIPSTTKASSLPPSLRPPPLSELPRIQARASPISSLLPSPWSPGKRKSRSSTPEMIQHGGQASVSGASINQASHGLPQPAGSSMQVARSTDIQTEHAEQQIVHSSRSESVSQHARAAMDENVDDALRAAVDDLAADSSQPYPQNQDDRQQHRHHNHPHQHSRQQGEHVQQLQPAQQASLPSDLQAYDREPPAMPDLVSGMRGYPSLPLPDLPEQALTSMSRGQPLDVAQPSAQQVPDLTPARSLASDEPHLPAQPSNLVTQPSTSIASLDEALPPASASSPARGTVQTRPASLDMVQKDHHMNIYVSPIQPHPNSPFQPPRNRKESGSSDHLEVSQINASHSTGRDTHSSGGDSHPHGSPPDPRRHTPGSRRRQISGGSSGSRNTPPDVQRFSAPIRQAQSDIVNAPPSAAIGLAHILPSEQQIAAATPESGNIYIQSESTLGHEPTLYNPAVPGQNASDCALNLFDLNRASVLPCTIAQPLVHIPQSVPISNIPNAQSFAPQPSIQAPNIISSAPLASHQPGLVDAHVLGQHSVPISAQSESQRIVHSTSQNIVDQEPSVVEISQNVTISSAHRSIPYSRSSEQNEPSVEMISPTNDPDLSANQIAITSSLDQVEMKTDEFKIPAPQESFKPRMSEDFVPDSDPDRPRQRDPRFEQRDDLRQGNQSDYHGDDDSRYDDRKRDAWRRYDREGRYDDRYRGYEYDERRYYDQDYYRREGEYYRPRSRTEEDCRQDERPGSRTSSGRDRSYRDYTDRDDGRGRPSSRQDEHESRSRSDQRGYDDRSYDAYYSSYYGNRGDYDRRRAAYDYDRYYERYYDDYYRMESYRRGYYDEMQQYYGAEQPQYEANGYYFDYYTRQWVPIDQYNRSHSRGRTPTLDQSSSRSSSRQSVVEYDDYRRRREDEVDASHQNLSSLDYTDNPSLLVDQTLPEVEQSMNKSRLTPVKFSRPHVIVRFTSHGQLIKVLPHRPDEGQPAVVEVHSVDGMTNPEFSDVDIHRSFPGPLVRGETHKNDVLSYCHTMARHCRENVKVVDRESAELIWKLLELMIRQNGTLVGTDIADLLLENHEPKSEDYAQQPDEGVLTADRSLVNRVPPLPMHEVTDRFRHLLLYGRKKDALDWATKHDLWGHALFLASKMDARTHASIMTRFANNAMRMNDPLQTLYQLMSHRQPASVTCIADHHWGDWRPHLAMILSATGHDGARTDGADRELQRRSLRTLGDTLSSRGCLHASHFCYLMAQTPFGRHQVKTSKIVLIGASHSLPLGELATTTEAVQCTEVYEYARSLANPAYVIRNFQVYKFMYAVQLLNCGLVLEAYHYCEVIARAIIQNPTAYSSTLVALLAELSCRLKTCDPQYQHSDYQQDPQWLTQLCQLVQAYQDGSIVPVSAPASPSYEPVCTEADPPAQHAFAASQYPYQATDNSGHAPSAEYEENAAEYQQNNQDSVDGGDQSNAAVSQTEMAESNQASAETQQQGPEPYIWDGEAWQVNPEWVELYYPGYAQQQQQSTADDQSVDPNNYDATDITQHSDDVTETGSAVTNGYDENGDEVDDLATSSASQQTFDYHGNKHSPRRRTLSASSTNQGPPVSPSAFETPPSRRGSLLSTRSHRSSGSRHSYESLPSPSRRSLEGSRAPSIGGRRSRTISQSSQVSSAPSSPGSTRSQESVIFNYNARRPPQGPPSGPSTPISPQAPQLPAPPQAPPPKKLPHGPGILRGLVNRLPPLFKSKNEMILPDDKDPTIVWDPDKKKWVNKDGDDEDDSTAAPPPKDSELMGQSPTASLASEPTMSSGLASPVSPGAPPTWNRLSKTRSRGARGQYVDVLNQSKQAVDSVDGALPSSLFNVLPSTTPASGDAGRPPMLFVPSPADHSSEQPTIGNPDSPPTTPDRQIDDNDISRSSSTSSLGREVQNFTHRGEKESTLSPSGTAPPAGGMLMFNPSQLQQQVPHVSGHPSRFKPGQRRVYPK